MEDYIFHICIVMCLPLFFYLRKSAGSDKSEKLRKLAFKNIITDHETTSYYLMRRFFSKKEASKINGGDKIIDDDGLRICKDKLNDDQVLSDPKLHFHILMRIAKFLLVQYQFKQAIGYIEQAIKIESENTVAILFLAEAYEYGGFKENAINTYNSIVKLNNNSVYIKDYVDIQLKRIEKHGPKKPMQLGLKYMSY